MANVPVLFTDCTLSNEGKAKNAAKGNGKIRDYSFLTGEKEHMSEVFSWWAVDHADELPTASAACLLDCAKCGCPILADRLKTNSEARKNGMKGGMRAFSAF